MVGLNVFFLNGGNYPGALLLLEKSIRAPCYFFPFVISGLKYTLETTYFRTTNILDI